MKRLSRAARWLVWLAAIGVLMVARSYSAHASDHLDTPTVIADPAADIGDLFAVVRTLNGLDP